MGLISPFSKSVLFLALAVLLLAAPMAAQKSGGGKSGGGSRTAAPSAPATSYSPSYRPRSTETEFDNNVVYLSGDNHPLLKNDLPPCYQWPMSPMLSSTVSVSGLEISPEAREQFSAGCSSIQKNKLKEAEQRLNHVVQLQPKYAAAWVLLGQASKAQGKMKEAADFCTQARDADANYLPGYLCLADLAAHEEKWDQVVTLTSQVIALHPVRAPGAYYYNCVANYFLQQWPNAEKSALQALQDSSMNEKAELHWLLAKIYEKEHNRISEAEQLRAYLKLAPDNHDASIARHILKEIETHAAK
jgi:tetratricopeptide (TPR) repeat protein